MTKKTMRIDLPTGLIRKRTSRASRGTRILTRFFRDDSTLRFSHYMDRRMRAPKSSAVRKLDMRVYNVHMLNRRHLLTSLAAAAVTPAFSQSGARFRKSICSTAFPGDMPVAEKFVQAKANGFEGIELRIGDELPMETSADDLSRLAD